MLVVEDELRMAALLKRGLEEDGYAVDIAATGPDALWQAREFDYDAVLLDLMLPGRTGSRSAASCATPPGGCWC